MSISEPFIRRPIGTALLAVGLLMIGVVAFPMLPIAPLPQVDFPTIQVTAKFPGASAEIKNSARSPSYGECRPTPREPPSPSKNRNVDFC